MPNQPPQVLESAGALGRPSGRYLSGPDTGRFAISCFSEGASGNYLLAFSFVSLLVLGQISGQQIDGNYRKSPQSPFSGQFCWVRVVGKANRSLDVSGAAAAERLRRAEHNEYCMSVCNDVRSDEQGLICGALRTPGGPKMAKTEIFGPLGKLWKNQRTHDNIGFSAM